MDGLLVPVMDIISLENTLATMVPKSIPTYTELFGPPAPAYDDLLWEVVPGSGILYCISLNGELNAPLEFGHNQLRIFQQALSAFSPTEQNLLVSRLLMVGQLRNDRSIGEFFFKPFILAMLVRELNRASGKPIVDIPSNGQFKLMQAYFLTVEQEYGLERTILDQALANRHKPDWEYRLLWGPMMRQFQLNEWVSPLVEFSKLFWLLKYAFDHWRPHLRQYLHRFDLKTIGQFAGSYKSLFEASMMTLPDKPLQKFIVIGDSNKAKHLAHLRINQLMDKPGIRLRDLKKKPVFQLPTGQYLIIDKEYLYKHIFRGPFFDLQRDPDGKPITKNYNSDVSIEVLEKYAFRSIMHKMNSPYGQLEFDQGQVKDAGVPDCYKRMGKAIFLLESKAAVFPDDLWEKPDYDKFRLYLEERFVKSKSGPKGVAQLANNIKTVVTGGFPFDPMGQTELEGLEIYPIIVHNDFQFSMPGINQFLQEHFRELIPSAVPAGVTIHPVILINLDWLFDLSLRGGTFEKLKTLIDRYHTIIKDRLAMLNTANRQNSQERFVRAKESFDLLYQFNFVNDLPQISGKEDLNLEELYAFSGLTQEILDTEV